jgi:uncharacterized protein YdaU (DUF1376 family)
LEEKFMSDQRGKTVSVYLDNDLDQLVVKDAEEQERSKSQIINKIVREHYKAQGKAKGSYKEYEKSKGRK